MEKKIKILKRVIKHNDVPIDDNASGSLDFTVRNDKHDGLVKHGVGNEDGTRFGIRNGMGPAMFADRHLLLHHDGQFVLRDKGVGALQTFAGYAISVKNINGTGEQIADALRRRHFSHIRWLLLVMLLL